MAGDEREDTVRDGLGTVAGLYSLLNKAAMDMPGDLYPPDMDDQEAYIAKLMKRVRMLNNYKELLRP